MSCVAVVRSLRRPQTLALLGAWAVLSCAHRADGPELEAPTPRAPVAPAFDEPMYGGTERFVLRDQVGPGGRASALVLVFGASWCEPCLEELPALGRLAQARAPIPFVVVGIDREAEGQAKLAEVVRPYPLVLLSDDDQSTADLYGVETLPTLLVLDGEGRLRSLHVGADPGVMGALARALDQVAPP